MIVLWVILEVIITFIVAWGLHMVLYRLFLKKFQPIASSMLTFISLAFIAYIITYYISSIAYPESIYFPIIIGWLIYDFIRIGKNKKI